MGLLLGASVLSILEVLDLFIYNTCHKISARARNNNSNNVNSRATPTQAAKVKDAWG